MAGENDTIRPDDLLLTAYLDGELAADERAVIEARLAAESVLRERMEQLARGTAGMGNAYGALLDAAPTDRLQAILGQAAQAATTRPARTLRWGRYAAALAAAIAIFIVGGVAGRLLPGAQQHDELNWRQVVAEYQSLTTTETLAAIPEVPDVLAPELKTMSDKLSVELTKERLALPGAILKRADLFNFSGRPLVQLAYLTQSDGPVALCIIPTPKPDAAVQFETRNGFNVAFWNDDGRAYMVIGKASRATLERFATVLASKV